MSSPLAVAICCGIFLCLADGRSSDIHLRDNGYTGIVIGIHRRIPENSTLIDVIKDKFTKASQQLYKSTKKRAYFKDITILLPTSWADKPEYGQVTGELYEKADVIISPANPRHRNTPYVKTYSGCGDPGVHMHLTQDYLTDPKSEDYYGPTEKLIVHEWAHFRWGVFDEYPTDGVQEFYFSPSTGKTEATRCTAAMRGRIWEYVDVGGGKKAVNFCKVDPITGTYSKNCHFYPHDNIRWQRGLQGSIMDRQYVPGVDFFCEHNKANPKINHNSESPSKHNRLCRGRSTWEVIEGTMDFRNRNNLPRDIPEDQLKPTFRIVRTRERRVVLVMDTSGSMTTEDKLTRMNQAAEQYILDGIDTNSELGIVEFSTSARMASPMRKIRGQGDRDILVNDLVRKAAGGTSIGAGLQKALDMLKAGGGKVQGSLILLITDGAENGSPKVMDIMPGLFMNSVTVDTLAYTYIADENLSAVSQRTGGKFYYDSNDPQSSVLTDAFFEMAAIEKEDDNRPIQVLSQAMMMKAGASESSRVVIEDSLGRDTLFVFTYTHQTPIEVMLTAPSGVQYTEHSSEYNRTDLKVIRYRVPNAESGMWQISITNPARAKHRTSYSVSSKPRDPTDQPITVQTQLSALSTDTMRITIYTEVTKGGHPVTGMTVTATVERLFSTPYKLQLLDNGLGADITKDDGVYSRYFTAFTANGRYSVSVKVTNDEGHGAVQESRLVGEAASFRVSTEDPLKFIPPDVLNKPSKVDTGVTRSAVAGAFEFKKSGTLAAIQPLTEVLLGKDLVAPGKITDLMVSMTSHANGTVTLTWTATGDDEDIGKATVYDIRMAEKYADLAELNGAKNVTQDMLATGNLTAPKPVGQREHFTIKVDTPPDQNASFVFNVRAVDEAGQGGEFSNIVTAGLGFVPDVMVVEMVEPWVYQEKLRQETTHPPPKTWSSHQSAKTPTSENTKSYKPSVKVESSTPLVKPSKESTVKTITTGVRVANSPFGDPAILGATVVACGLVVVAIIIVTAMVVLRCSGSQGKVSQAPPVPQTTRHSNVERSVRIHMTNVNMTTVNASRLTPVDGV